MTGFCVGSGSLLYRFFACFVVFFNQIFVIKFIFNEFMLLVSRFSCIPLNHVLLLLLFSGIQLSHLDHTCLGHFRLAFKLFILSPQQPVVGF